MASRQTNFEVLYELLDVSASGDAGLTVSNVKDFSDISLLTNKETNFADEATLEHNFFVLDGTIPEWEDSRTGISYFSSTKSNSSGTWESNVPGIDIQFTANHSSYALTLDFVNDCVLEARITWKYNNITLISRVFELGKKKCLIEQDVENYNHIIIEFTKTIPDRYVKLNYIYFGAELLWGEDTIKQGTMVREVDPISEKLPVDTLSFDIIDNENHLLNMANPSGLYRYFQTNQPVYAYEYVNGEKIKLGKFFLKTYKHNGNIGKLSCVSYMGLLDNVEFQDGEIYNGVKAGIILDTLFAKCGITDYTIDDVTYNQVLYGTLKPQKARTALREILFACHSVVDTSDSDAIIISKASSQIKHQITRNVKFSTDVTSRDYITSVILKFPKFSLASSSTELVSDAHYSIGTHRTVFNNAVDTSTITFSDMTGVTILKKMPYYVEFTCSVEKTLTISGTQYEEVESFFQATREIVDSGKPENVKTFKSQLCDYTTAPQIAQDILAFYEKNFEIKIKALTGAEDLEDVYGRRIVENSFQGMNNYMANFVSRTFDLTGGFIENSKLIGEYNEWDKVYFAGHELIADNDVII